MLRAFSLLLLLAASVSLGAQDLCEDLHLTGLYLNPYEDSVLYVGLEVEDPELFISYPNLRVYADPEGDDVLLGEVPMPLQTFGWAGHVMIQVALNDPWQAWFSMEGTNPELRLEIWSNFFTTLECEETVNANDGPFYPFSNDFGDGPCEDQLAGSLYGSATWGQAATVHALLERVIDGVPVDPPLLDVVETWSDVATTFFYCLDPSACYQLTVPPIEVGPDPYWLAINADSDYFESWTWITLQGLEPVVVDFSPYGGVSCTTTHLDEAPEIHVELWPQPANTILHVSGFSSSNDEVSVWNLSGQFLGNRAISPQGTLSVTDLPSGTYILQFESASGSFRERVMVTH